MASPMPVSDHPIASRSEILSAHVFASMAQNSMGFHTGCQRHSITAFRNNPFMDTYGSRLAHALALRDMSVTDLSKATGIPYSTLKGIVDGHQRESTKTAKIAETLKVRAGWLGDGRGPVEPIEPDYDDITGFSQAVGLGQESEIAEYEETHKLKFRADSLGRKRLIAGKLNVVYGKGDSMLPRIKSGDAILFDTSDRTPRDGKIFIICYPSRTGGTACSAKQCMELDGHYYFQSLNNDGDHDWKKPRRADDEKRPIEIMGRVRWIGSWED